MKKQTIFTKFLGNTPKIKVLDLLITGMDFDYCLSDIAENADIGRTTLYRMLNELLKEKILMPTKKIGNIQLYKLNLANSYVKQLVKLYDNLLKQESEKEIERQKSKSAKNIRNGALGQSEVPA